MDHGDGLEQAMDGIRWVGLALTWLGYLAAVMLVVQPFHAGMQVSTMIMSLLAPGCMGVGLLLCAVGESRVHVLRISGTGLLLLGLAALLGLFATGLGMVEAGDTLMLWIIAPTALVLGVMLTHAGNALASHLAQTAAAGQVRRRL